MSNKIVGNGCLVAAIIMAVLYALSWGVTCGILYLIAICFGLTFKWSIATGIWLIMCLIWPLFKNGNSK